MHIRLFVLVSIAIAAVALALAWRGRLPLPAHWNPWAPLAIADPPGPFTGYKLARLSGDDAECLRVLSGARMRYTTLQDRETGTGCGFDNAVRIAGTSMAVRQPFSLSCRMAVALALWERHVVQPAAQREFGQRAVRLEHFGSYACRNLYGRASGSRSRHATADALDVAGFVLEDGTRIRVAQDWNDEDAAARFLHAIHAGACPFFSSVLGPAYNAAHRDHLHLDRGGFGICR